MTDAPERRSIRLVITTPMTNPAIATSEVLTAEPLAPATARPMNTRFPVMVATNTSPRRRMLVASTTPASVVKASSKDGSGPSNSSRTARLRASNAGARGFSGSAAAGWSVKSAHFHPRPGAKDDRRRARAANCRLMAIRPNLGARSPLFARRMAG
jgi:hypothetical protein